MTYGSLFTGIGGIDLGLDRARFRCKWQVENDPYAIKVLEKHWPSVKRYGDITRVTGDELEPVDLICGGFPCQDLSQAGKQAGIEGTRSGLWFEYARLVWQLRPRYVLIENVAGLLVSDAMRRVVGELARLGYVGCWRSLRASEFGASHLRKRVFIVAYRNERRRERELSGCNGLANGGHAQLGNAERTRRPQAWIGRHQYAGAQPEARNGELADTLRTGLEVRDGKREQQLRQDAEPFAPGLPDGEVAYATGNDGGRRIAADNRSNLQRDASRQCDAARSGDLPQFAPGPSDPRWPAILRERPDLAPALESPLRGVASWLSREMDGAMSNRTKRLGRLGNSVVPQIAEWLGNRILEFEDSL